MEGLVITRQRFITVELPLKINYASVVTSGRLFIASLRGFSGKGIPPRRDWKHQGTFSKNKPDTERLKKYREVIQSLAF